MKDLKIVSNGEFYGVVGKNNTVIVPCIYDEIVRTFSSGLINVCKNDKWGCLDLSGNVVIPLEYDWISPFGKDDSSISCAKKNGKWGVLNKKGAEIIQCIYDEEIVFKHDIAIVVLNGKRGLIEKNGKIITPCQYLYLEPLADSLVYFKFIDNGKYGIIGANGDIVVHPTYSNPDCLYMLNLEKPKKNIKKESIERVNCNNSYEAIKFLHKDYEIVEPFYPHLGIYVVGKLNKMGVVIFHDNKADIVVPVEYDQITELFKNAYLLLAKQAEKYRVIKVTKKITNISPFYDKIGEYFSYSGLVPVKKGIYVGCVNNMAEEVIPVQYDLLGGNYVFHTISADKLVMKKNGKWGIMANDGKILLPFEYDEIDEGVIYRIKGVREVGWRKWHVERTQDNTIVGYRNLLEGKQISGSGLIPVKKSGLWGLLDEYHFKEIIPCSYLSIQQNTSDKIILFKKVGYDLLISTKDGYKIESETNVNLEQYSKIGEFEDHLASVKKDGKFGFVNEEYKEIVPCIYDEVGPFIHGLSIVRIGEMHGAINNEGSVTIPLEYSILLDISLFGPTLLMAVKNNRSGVIDKANNIIVPFEFDLVQAMAGMITVTKNGKKGIYNQKGKLVIPIIYDDIHHPWMGNTSIDVCKNGKWGVIDNKGETIIPMKYDGIKQVSSGYMYSACDAGKWGIINKKGETITSFIYDKIDENGLGFTCGRLSVCKNGKWGFIDKKGFEVIECAYDKVYDSFEEDHCEVKLKGEKIMIDLYGNRIG